MTLHPAEHAQLARVGTDLLAAVDELRTAAAALAAADDAVARAIGRLDEVETRTHALLSTLPTPPEGAQP